MLIGLRSRRSDIKQLEDRNIEKEGRQVREREREGGRERGRERER